MFSFKIHCCSSGTPVPNPGASPRNTNSKQKALDEDVHGHVKYLLGTEFIENPRIGYNPNFIQFMSASCGNSASDNNRELLLVVFQHNTEAFAALVKSDQLQDQDQDKVIETLIDNISFNDGTPKVSENGPPMYVAYLGMDINSGFSVSDAVKECFSNPPSFNMGKTTNKFKTFKRNTSVGICNPDDVITIEEKLNFDTNIPQKPCHRPVAPIVLQADPTTFVRIPQCCFSDPNGDPVQ